MYLSKIPDPRSDYMISTCDTTYTGKANEIDSDGNNQISISAYFATGQTYPPGVFAWRNPPGVFALRNPPGVLATLLLDRSSCLSRMGHRHQNGPIYGIIMNQMNQIRASTYTS